MIQAGWGPALRRVLLLACLSLVLPGCAALQPKPDQPDQSVPADAVTRISYGRAGGLCAGYCVHRLDIDAKIITLTDTAMVNSGAFPDKVRSLKMPAPTWQALLADVNWERFKALPERIGCPGCADGGYAWLEIERGGVAHRVSYEDPAALPDQAGLLRTVNALYEHLAKPAQ